MKSSSDLKSEVVKEHGKNFHEYANESFSQYLCAEGTSRFRAVAQRLKKRSRKGAREELS